MPTLITDTIFAAFLQCGTKAHLVAIQTPEPQHDISQWRSRLIADYKTECLGRLAAFHEIDVRCHGTPPISALKSRKYHFIVNCKIGNEGIESQVDALQLTTIADKSAPAYYLPIRVLPHDTITSNDKLLLAFDALALGTMFSNQPPRGLIIHGSPQRTLTVDLSTLIETARHHIGEISTQLTQAPKHHLNRHCSECAFQESCHDIAASKDDLSLLRNMHKREQEKQNRKGIFDHTTHQSFDHFVNNSARLFPISLL